MSESQVTIRQYVFNDSAAKATSQVADNVAGLAGDVTIQTTQVIRDRGFVHGSVQPISKSRNSRRRVLKKSGPAGPFFLGVTPQRRRQAGQFKVVDKRSNRRVNVPKMSHSLVAIALLSYGVRSITIRLNFMLCFSAGCSIVLLAPPPASADMATIEKRTTEKGIAYRAKVRLRGFRQKRQHSSA